MTKVPAISKEQLGTPESVRQFEQSGALCIDGFISKEKVNGLYAGILEHLVGLSEDEPALLVGGGRHMSPVPMIDVFDDPEIFAPDELRSFLAQLYGKDFVLNCFTCVNADPGADEQHVHRDYDGLFADRIDSFCPSFAVNLIIPLVPFNDQNGTTRVWPGSHRKPDLADEADKADFCDPELVPGSAMLMDYRLRHGGTANRSNAKRPALFLGYSRDWFLDTMHYKTINPLQIDLATLDQRPAADKHLLSRARMYATLAAQRAL